MTDLATITVRQSHGQPVVAVRGEIDFSVVRSLQEAILQAVLPTAQGLILDLSETTYLDSAAIHLLVRVTDQLSSHRQRFCVVIPAGSPLLRLITIAGLGDVLAVGGEVDAAASSLVTGGP